VFRGCSRTIGVWLFGRFEEVVNSAGVAINARRRPCGDLLRGKPDEVLASVAQC
jgi:hypothetical protein